VHVGVAQNELNEVQNFFIIIILFNGILSYIRIKQFLKKWTYGRCDVTRYSEIRGTGFPMTSRWRHADMVTRGMCVVVVVIIHWRRRVVDGVATDWSLHHDWKHTRTNETRKSPSTAACQLNSHALQVSFTQHAAAVAVNALLFPAFRLPHFTICAHWQYGMSLHDCRYNRPTSPCKLNSFLVLFQYNQPAIRNWIINSPYWRAQQRRWDRRHFDKEKNMSWTVW